MGEVTFVARRYGTPDSSCIEFEVRDSGIGVTNEQMSRIFEIFSQTESTTKNKYGGTGLGLALSRRMARLMGGDITVESEPGTGTIFCVILPTTVEKETDAGTTE